MGRLKKLFSFAGYLLLPFVLLFSLFVYSAVAKPIWQLAAYHNESAIIVSCTSMHNRNVTRYAPVARNQERTYISGKVFASNSRCISQINDTVSVLINPNDHADGVMLTLGQFEHLPMVFIVFCSIFS
jgi:hypothetical protein